MRVDRDEVLVDIGSKAEGIVPTKEFSSLTPSEKEALIPGDTRACFHRPTAKCGRPSGGQYRSGPTGEELASAAGNLRRERRHRR